MGILSKINIGADLDNRLEIIRMFERTNETRKVLEIGPGERPLILEYPGNGIFFGIEYPGFAGKTIEVFREKGKTILMKECDIDTEEWPFRDNEFDVIVSNQVIEHLANTDHFFEEFYRIMKKGGYGIISTPNLSSLHNIIQLLLSFQPVFCNVSDKFLGLGNPLSSQRFQRRPYPFHSHLRIFTTRALVDMCRVYGFKVEDIKGGTFMGIPLLGRFLSRLLPYYSYYCEVKIRKI